MCCTQGGTDKVNILLHLMGDGIKNISKKGNIYFHSYAPIPFILGSPQRKYLIKIPYIFSFNNIPPYHNSYLPTQQRRHGAPTMFIFQTEQKNVDGSHSPLPLSHSLFD